MEETHEAFLERASPSAENLRIRYELLVSAKNLEAFSKTLFSRTAQMQGVYMPHYRGKAAE